MANVEHFEKLKNGVKFWNEWRLENKFLKIDLSDLDLRNLELINADFSWANLENVNFSGSEIHGVKFYMSNLRGADLSNSYARNLNLFKSNLFETNLERVHIRDSIIFDTDLRRSNLTNGKILFSNCYGSNFSNCKLENVDFHSSDLREVIFNSAKIAKTNFGACLIGSTIFTGTDLSTSNLNGVYVSNYCPFDFETLKNSKLPKEFLLKIGLSENFINYLPDLYQQNETRFYPCFLSHSSEDKLFARKLYDALTAKGVLVWFDEKSLKPGDHLEEVISKGISMYDKTILICSENSLNSWWVNRELDRVLDKEHSYYKSSTEKKHILIPVKIDQYLHIWDNSRKSDIKKYVVGDFINWKNPNSFNESLNQLIVALNVDRPDINPISYL